MFDKIIKNLRESKSLNQKELGIILKISASSIGMWEQNRRNPDKDMLIKIADYFDVTVDFLLGRTANQPYNTYDTLSNKKLKQKITQIENINKDGVTLLIKDRIRIERINANLNQPELANLLNTTKQTISNWENGYRTPDIIALNSLADLFKCTVDYLIGRTDNKNSKIYIPTSGEHNYTIELEKGLKQKITQDELNELIKKLEKIGFDVNKLLERRKSQ